MGFEGVGAGLFLAASLAISVGAVTIFARFAPAMGLVDLPGGRKSHDRAVPLVGGLAIFVALLASAWLVGLADRAGYFLLALSIVIAVGFWDDVSELSPRLKFAIQIVASAIMIWGAGIVLRSVGDLLGWRPIGLSLVAIPMTVFAVVGVVNAMNMMDGLDGLGGSIAFVAFAWYAIVASDSGLSTQLATALIFCGAIAGFLIFNLRFPWQPRARVFLGDAGSLMIGFALGWFAIDLTQGPGRTFPPIAALWVVMLPLADCVSLMARRFRSRKSPFVGDAHHIHHYLQRRGFTATQTLVILVTVSTAFGAVGYVGWKARVPEAVMFWPFFFGFFGYHFWIKREWARLQRQPAIGGYQGEESVVTAK
jgi:UDP-GlcNAc:undecaprenyl-phosphate GlcNAc-1-phosphate transferase